MRLPTYTEHKEREIRITSAVNAIKAILPADLYPAHKRELLDICIWKITEADGKWRTRYRSLGALEASADTKLQHEHVVEKQKIVSELILGNDSVENIVARAVGCVVTKDEHVRLTSVSRHDSSLDGWNRYKAGGVRVFDLKTGKEVEY